MEILSIQELTNLACVRYGQLINPLSIYNLTDDNLETLLKDVVEEYSHFIPMTKELKVYGSSSGTFLGDDIISVRNVRMDNFYFSKLSPRMDRRQKKFNPHTKMLYMPVSMQVIVECGAKYPVGRIQVVDDTESVLVGDTNIIMKVSNFRHKTLSLQTSTISCNDKNSDYSENLVVLDCEQGDAIYNQETTTLTISNLEVTENSKITLKYNTDKPVVQGLSLRDRLFVDLFIGRLMLALGNIKSQIVMDGDVIAFSSDDLISQGQTLVDSTLNLLMSSSTTYKII